MVSSLFSIYLFIVNNFKCNCCTIYNSCRPMLKLSSAIVANLQEMAYFNMAEYSPSFVPCACDVGLFCIYHVWDVYKFWNGLEWLFNGHDFVLWPFCDGCLRIILVSVHFCIIYFKPHCFFCIAFWVWCCRFVIDMQIIPVLLTITPQYTVSANYCTKLFPDFFKLHW